MKQYAVAMIISSTIVCCLQSVQQKGEQNVRPFFIAQLTFFQALQALIEQHNQPEADQHNLREHIKALVSGSDAAGNKPVLSQLEIADSPLYDIFCIEGCDRRASQAIRLHACSTHAQKICHSSRKINIWASYKEIVEILHCGVHRIQQQEQGKKWQDYLQRIEFMQEAMGTPITYKAIRPCGISCKTSLIDA